MPMPHGPTNSTILLNNIEDLVAVKVVIAWDDDDDACVFTLSRYNWPSKITHKTYNIV